MIYISSPYSHPLKNVMEFRFNAVEKYTAELLKQGKIVYSPIVHCHEIAKKYNMPTDYNFWMNYNHGMLMASDEMYVLTLDGWEESKGIAGEIDFCEAINIPVTVQESNYE